MRTSSLPCSSPAWPSIEFRFPPKQNNKKEKKTKQQQKKKSKRDGQLELAFPCNFQRDDSNMLPGPLTPSPPHQHSRHVREECLEVDPDGCCESGPGSVCWRLFFWKGELVFSPRDGTAQVFHVRRSFYAGLPPSSATSLLSSTTTATTISVSQSCLSGLIPSAAHHSVRSPGVCPPTPGPALLSSLAAGSAKRSCYRGASQSLTLRGVRDRADSTCRLISANVLLRS